MEGISKGRVDYLMSQEEDRIKRQRRKRLAPERRLCDYQKIQPSSEQMTRLSLFHRMVDRLRPRRDSEPLH